MASLRQIAWIVGRDVNVSFGGNAAIELLRRSFVPRRWLDDSTHAVVVGVSRLTPGTNILAYCTAVGWILRGWRGSAAALTAASLPAALLIYTLISVLTRAMQYRIVRAAMAIGLLVACYLVFAASWALIRPYLRGPMRTRAIVVSVAALALFLAGMTPVRILLLSAAIGFLVPPRAATSAPPPAAVS